MKWIARIAVFTGALVFGTFAAALISSFILPSSNFGRILFPLSVETPSSAKSLLGTWKGTWGYNDGDCMLLIDRVEGNAFYGTLRKEGAVIRFEGTFDPKTRAFYFDEIEVLRLGAHMSGWSLGKNSGIISRDGRILAGDGHDKWGQYTWAASNY